MRVAVLGAGFQGTCVALELAARGVAVDLYDRNDACITQAGRWNEGKIHLGFVYANDRSLNTSRLMAHGALTFDRALARWLETNIASIGVSPPFDYIVHRDSLLDPEQLVAHFTQVTDYVSSIAAERGLTYLGEDARATSFRISPNNGEVYDPAVATMVLSTSERTVNTGVLARTLARRVADDPRINFLPHSEVRGVKRNGNALDVQVERAGARLADKYDQVVNCLWDSRRVLDREFGLVDDRPWLFRLKLGIRLRLKQGTAAIPTTTIVLGSFGDVVRIDDRQIYLSWYPVCLAGISSEIAPPPWPRNRTGETAQRIIAESLAGLGAMVLPLRELTDDMIESSTVAGGIIAAAGETDIDDPNSRLHMRIDVGVCSVDGYHSIDTGKYTLAPMYALEVADRICGPR
ncbi:MAG TPA: FAD-dependent oxidoreductase [Xanthobacteraceae bacterium]|nr:FAD-dependent oxidoreductase [Xanthobacteraceae bacterium]